MRDRILGTLALLAIFVGMLAVAIPRFQAAMVRAKEAEVVANMYLMKASLEEYARYTDGLYPLDLDVPTAALNPEAKRSFTLKDLFPQGLRNPFGQGPAIAVMPPESDPPDRGAAGTVVYIPLGVVEAPSGTKAAGYFVLYGYGARGRRLDLVLRSSPPYVGAEPGGEGS